MYRDDFDILSGDLSGLQKHLPRVSALGTEREQVREEEERAKTAAEGGRAGTARGTGDTQLSPGGDYGEGSGGISAHSTTRDADGDEGMSEDPSNAQNDRRPSIAGRTTTPSTLPTFSAVDQQLASLSLLPGVATPNVVDLGERSHPAAKTTTSTPPTLPALPFVFDSPFNSLLAPFPTVFSSPLVDTTTPYTVAPNFGSSETNAPTLRLASGAPFVAAGGASRRDRRAELPSQDEIFHRRPRSDRSRSPNGDRSEERPGPRRSWSQSPRGDRSEQNGRRSKPREGVPQRQSLPGSLRPTYSPSSSYASNEQPSLSSRVESGHLPPSSSRDSTLHLSNLNAPPATNFHPTTRFLSPSSHLRRTRLILEDNPHQSDRNWRKWRDSTYFSLANVRGMSSEEAAIERICSSGVFSDAEDRMCVPSLLQRLGS